MAEESKRWRKKKRDPEKGSKDQPRDEKKDDAKGGSGETRRKKLYG